MRSLRLDQATIQKMLDSVDSTENVAPRARDRRRAERYGYRLKGCVVHLQQPGDPGPVAYLAPTRNLSAGGIAFVHGGFVHNGSRCVIQLVTQQETWNNVVGTVVGCRLMQGTAHEVCVRFDQGIDPSLYCPEAVKVRVLLAEDDVSLVRLAKVYLDSLNATVDHAPDGRVAVEKASENVYDVILMDMEMPVMDGFEATSALRAQGYSGKIVAATALDEDSDRQKCIDAGCDAHIAKPYRRDDLAKLFETIHEEPLISSLANEASMVGLIDEFVKELPEKLRSVEEAAASADLSQVAIAARMLKSDAGGYGFDPIADTAAKIEKAARAESPIEQIKPLVSELSKWCLLARSPSVAGSTRDEDDAETEAEGEEGAGDAEGEKKEGAEEPTDERDGKSGKDKKESESEQPAATAAAKPKKPTS